MKQITNFSELDLNGTYSYADYLAWKFEERVELIKGRIFKMSPAPNLKHQIISANLAGMLWNFFKKHECRVFNAPFDVRLEDSIKKANNAKNTITVVQPDICVICDINKLDDKGCIGAPDWIIEIVSPSTAERDLKVKKRLYEENGVREYWIVFPVEEFVQAFVLGENGKYGDDKIEEKAKMASPTIFPNLNIELVGIFE
jgi:Uma2 family endonuclease